MISTLNKLHEAGDLKKLYDSGFLSPRAVLWRNIFLMWHKKTIIGISVSQAAFETSKEYGVSERTVYKAIAALRED